MDIEIKDIEDVVIVGSGPAGYTAALYTSRADLNPLVIEGFAWGGLLQQTTDVENYPGYPEGVMGPVMMQEFRDQAARFGTRFLTDDATKIDLASEPGGLHTVHVGSTEIKARAIILSMGAEPKKLGVPGEEELAARGVSYCATCDAAFFRGKQTIVVGGGDTAMEDATFLAKFADKVGHRPPAARVPRVGDHARPRARQGQHRPRDPVRGEELRRRRRRRAQAGDAREHRGRLGARAAGQRCVRRDRPPSKLASRRRAARARRGGLRPGRGPLDAHQAARSVRRRRPDRPRLPPGRDGRGHRLHGRARRGGLPARHADRPRGALGARAGQGRGGGGVGGLLAGQPCPTWTQLGAAAALRA